MKRKTLIYSNMYVKFFSFSSLTYRSGGVFSRHVFRTRRFSLINSQIGNIKRRNVHII